MKTKKRFIKPLIKIFAWALIMNIVIEFMLIYILMSTPLDYISRVDALIIIYETWGRRNYTNTISVIPDELVGTWVIESAGGYCSSEEAEKTILILHSDQTFEIVYPVNNHSKPPSIPRKYARWNSGENEMIYLRGNWGTMSRKSSFFYSANTTEIVGRYEGTDEYVSLGNVLDRHVSSAKNRFAIKWRREEDKNHLRPDYGIYLKQNYANLNE